MTPEMIDVLLSLGGLVLAVVGLPVLYLQLRGRFCAETLGRSPIRRQHLEASWASYSDALRRRLGPGA